MKIKLDRTKCDGFGLCVKYAPEVFDEDEWGYVSLNGGGNVMPEQEDGVRRALLDCPVHAIVELRQAPPVDAEPVAAVSA